MAKKRKAEPVYAPARERKEPEKPKPRAEPCTHTVSDKKNGLCKH